MIEPLESLGPGMTWSVMFCSCHSECYIENNMGEIEEEIGDYKAIAVIKMRKDRGSH